MTTSTELHHNQTEATEPIVSWLRAHDLVLPAWMILNCIQPFGWMLGQGCLLLEPLGRGLGLDEVLVTAMQWLENPAALAALTEALTPAEEDRS